MSSTEIEPSAQPRSGRRRIWVFRIAGLLVAVSAIVAALGFWANTAQFQDMFRRALISKLQNATGGRVEIGSFRCRLSDLEVEAKNVVIHGDEAATDDPYARVDRLRAKISILGFWWSPNILLRDLEIERPQLHLILYPDGLTNQPHPAKPPKKSNTPAMETLFNLQAGHVAVENGMLDIDDRVAEALDTQNRYQPLDFRADDLGLVMRYIPAANQAPEMYRIDASVKDLNLSRSGALKQKLPVHGYLESSIDLTRDAATLRFLRLTARAKGVPDRTLNISGALNQFSRPRWQAVVKGELDLRLLDLVVGYPYAPEGLAHLDLTSGGDSHGFRIDGTVRADKASYVGTGVVAHGIELNTRVHADSQQLLITGISARLAQGGEIDGEVLLHNWLPTSVQPVVVEAAAPPEPAKKGKHFFKRQPKPPPPAPVKPQAPPHATVVKSPLSVIPVNGRVNTTFKNVSVDTVLEMVSVPPFQHLGFNALLNGPAVATWEHGDVRTLNVTSTLSLTGTGRFSTAEAPAMGIIDATYTQADGAVNVRNLEVQLPASHIAAHGRVGAYPLTSPTSLTVDFHTSNLSEFDTLFRDLGVTRNGKAGTAALPVGIKGQADFRGTWEGSLASPRMNGQLQATQVAIELPSDSGEPRIVNWDTIEAEGSYTAERISVMHAQLQHGEEQIVLNGTLAATPPAITAHKKAGQQMPAFDNQSILTFHARAGKVSLPDLLGVAGIDAPLTGTVDAQIEGEGPVNSLNGSGSLTLKDGSAYGEPVNSVSLQGSVNNHVLTVKEATAATPSGNISVHGTYDMRTRVFDAQTSASGLELAKLKHLRDSMPSMSGRLGMQFTASGTIDDPRIDGHGTVNGLSVRGQSFGDVAFKAHAANHAILYDASTQFESAHASVHGQTQLHDPYETEGNLKLDDFDLGTIFKLAHVQNPASQSIVSGTAQFSGPLARPKEMRGDLRLPQAAITVSGMTFKSEGGVHAALDKGRVILDPLHITGEDTNLRAQGSMNLEGTQNLDVALNGSVNMKIAQSFDPDLTATGNSIFEVEAHGPLADPELRGRVKIENGAFALEDIPNGISQLNGTLEFNKNRLEIRQLQAVTGGGKVDIGGYLAYQHGLFSNLTVTAQGVRIRYPEGVSSMVDANLQVQGTQANTRVSGRILITRFSISPDLDIAALAAQANAVHPVASPNAPSNRITLDLRIQSSPQLNFQNAFAKLAGDVDLRLRGTLASPSLLGRISVTEGNATIAGTRYELQRGDVTFTNPVRIQPNIDISATARVEDYDINLGLHGTPDKMSVTYRSDPPLPETDVVALLALGRTQSTGLYTQQQQQSAGLTRSSDVLLGGALNATVSSRVEKLFGAGSVKVDPSYLGAMGNTTTRITVEEQLGKNVTLTYATNVDTTSQQFLQAEFAINRHVSLQVTRDESGVFSMVVKAVRRYR
ncbi:translocation/assembly module TamB domain-containing protein [Occallatibacter riparius]|uniref:Translocation/assembly module TamB domain-containing protein n=1 Tax=Occallatibacter riparius TaxID=1002689 RepID=A0A9J7BS28_9BACT|nr:translocation/assembly module TamB domain-containing protein [Occallatibacter riparius]UWZ83853.1 translocation/assembly module TamB domain-containing protein [Occallatibacter riparius]